MVRCAKVPRDRSEAELSAPHHELFGEEVDAPAALEVLGSIAAVDAKERQALLEYDVAAAAGRVALQVLDDLTTNHCTAYESRVLLSDDDAVPGPRPRHEHRVVPGLPSHEVDVLLAVVAHDAAGLAHHLCPI